MKMITSAKPVTSGQKDGCASVVADAARKATRKELDAFDKVGRLNSVNMQKVAANSVKVATAVAEVVRKKIAEIVSGVIGCLKLISAGDKVVLDPTEGTETLATATDLFGNNIDSDFKNWGCDGTEKPTVKTVVDVYEHVENADYRKMFGSFGQNLDRLCLTTPQIKKFVSDHADKYLREDGWAYFLFLFKVKNKETGKDEFFVAHVHRRSVGYRKVSVRRFGRGRVWRAEYRRRVVVPQLVLES